MVTGFDISIISCEDVSLSLQDVEGVRFISTVLSSTRRAGEGGDGAVDEVR